MHDRTSTAPTFPDAEYVGQHLVIDKTEWVPGPNPEPHLREDGQTTYPETYLRCIRCGAERMRTHDFPAECDDPAAPDRRASDDAETTDDGRAEPRIDSDDVTSNLDIPGVGD